MITKIGIIVFRNQRNDEHYEFGKDFGEHVTALGPVQLKIEPLFAEWAHHFDLEDLALRKIVKSPLTEKINEVARIRDRNFRGVAGMNKSLTFHYEPKLAKSASELQVVFDTYGNIKAKGLAEKGAAYSNLIQELQHPKYETALDEVGISAWLDVLADNNDEVFQLTQQRYNENSEKPELALKQARDNVDAAYRAICRRITAALEMAEDDEERQLFISFIRRLNVIIDRYNNLMAARKGRGGNSSVELA